MAGGADHRDAADKVRSAISWIVALTVAVLPLVMVPALQDSFTLPKVALMRFAVGISILLWSIRLALSGWRWRPSPLDWAVGAFVMSVVAAALLSTNPRLSIFGHYKRYEDVSTLLIYALIFWVTTNNLRAADVRRVVTLWLAGGLLVATYACVQYVGYDFVATSVRDGRAIATLGNPVFLGSWLVLTLPLAINRWLDGRRVYLIVLIVLVAAVAVTFSRAAWLGLAFGLPALALFRRRAGLAGRGWLIALVAVVLVFGILNFARPPGASYRLAERASSVVDSDRGTAKTRLLLWRTTLASLPERPFFGYGPDALGALYDAGLPDEYREIEPLARIDKAHNDILNTAATLGLIGLFAYLVIIGIFYQSAWGSLSENRDNPTGVSREAAALLAGITGYLVALQFSFSQAEVSFFFWLALGLFLVAVGAVGPERDRVFGLRTSPIGWIAPAILGFFCVFWLHAYSWVPMVADYHFNLGVQAEGRDAKNIAAREFERATELSGVRSIYYSRLGRRLQLDLMRTEIAAPQVVKPAERQAVLAAYGAAEKLDPTNALLYTSIGSYYAYLARTDSRFLDLAEAALERSLAINPKISETHVNVGVLKTDQGDLSAAAVAFRQALKLDPDNEVARRNLAALKGK